MRYYQIKQDKDYQSIPELINWQRLLNIQKLYADDYSSLPDRMLFRIRDKQKTVFTDIIFAPFFLISKEFRECLGLYEPNLTFKEVVLLNQTSQEAREYFLPQLAKLDCLTERSIFHMDGSRLINIELDLAKVKDKSIFALSGVRSRYVIARLDVVESLLRRGTSGFLLEEVDCIRLIDENRT